ncbi:collagen binding domain-containing protein [Geomicrobium sp. JCM 19039]|uniref:collagen binding domain-containing protein n=1 Tax=Geomicrobium sp. JCM 19039 TaxID=1460636 RepID=UPI00045F2E0F|nr:collagen binding domain-containing protein [Geomicrobium sp. JCM 19039]GAK13138.1 collagen adhesion protein [Geomicrobium sp. JCM 19039]
MKRKSTMVLLAILLFMQPFMSTLGMERALAEGPSTEITGEAKLLDSEGNEISENNQVEPSSSVHIALSWQLNHEGEQEEYIWTLPDQLHSTDVEDSLVSHNGQVVGKYSVNSGRVHIQIEASEDPLNEQGTMLLESTLNEGALAGEEREDVLFNFVKHTQSVPIFLQGASPEENQENEKSTGVESEDDQNSDENSEENHENKEGESTETDAVNEIEGSSEEIQENIITSVELRDENGNIIDAGENPGNNPSLGDAADISMDWALPNGHGYQAGSTFTFQLPQQFEVFNDVEGDLLADNGSVGTFTLSMNNTVVMTFNEQIEELSNVHGILWFQTVIREELEGAVEQEIVFHIKNEDVARIPVRFQPPAGNDLDKAGEVDRAYNATSVTWTVDLNKQMKSLDNVALQDPIEDNQALKPDTIRVYELDVNLDGSVSRGNEVPANEFTINDHPFAIEFGDISKAYRVEFETTITDEEGTNYRNVATLIADNQENMTADASVSTGRGVPLAKESKDYDPITQTIDWEIRYNYNENEIPEADALLVDSFSDEHNFVDGSLQVERITIDADGNESGSTVVNYVSLIPTNEGFNLQFTQDIEDAYKITYQTRANDLVVENGRITNTVGTGGNEANAGVGTEQQVLHKWHTNINYNSKTVDWVIDINRNGYESIT